MILKRSKLVGSACQGRSPGSTGWRSAAQLKRVISRGLGKERVPELLGVPIEVADAERVDPAAAVAAGCDVLEIAEDLVALVLLEELVGEAGIAGLRAGVDSVEEARLLVEVEARGPGNARTSWET